MMENNIGDSPLKSIAPVINNVLIANRLMEVYCSRGGARWGKSKTIHEHIKALRAMGYTVPVSYTHLTLPTNREV